MTKFEDFPRSIRKSGQNLSTSTASRESSKKSYKIQKKISTFYWDIAETQKFVWTCPQMYVGTYPIFRSQLLSVKKFWFFSQIWNFFWILWLFGGLSGGRWGWQILTSNPDRPRKIFKFVHNKLTLVNKWLVSV